MINSDSNIILKYRGNGIGYYSMSDDYITIGQLASHDESEVEIHEHEFYEIVKSINNMSKLLIIATIFCFTSLSAHGQDVVKTNQTDSLDIIGLYENLPEIMVVGERPIVKLEDGKLSYNIPILLERIPADNAFDALKNIPGINVKNENVDFAGQPLTLIIDGKINAMSYQQVVDRLKMIPAEQIEKVEFMLSTPARYHVREASLNIITKRHKGNKHFSGQVQGGYTQSKYAAGEAKGNILYSNNKLTIDASYSYTNINAYAEAEHEAHHPLNNEKVAYYDLTTNRNKGHSHQYRTGIDYQFTANHALNVAYTGGWTSYKQTIIQQAIALRNNPAMDTTTCIMLIYITIFRSVYRLQQFTRIMKLPKTNCLTENCMRQKRTLWQVVDRRSTNGWLLPTKCTLYKTDGDFRMA